MASTLVISVDTMGGDLGPASVIGGVRLALIRHPGLRFILFGDEAELRRLVAQHAGLSEVVTIRHTPDIVTMDAKAGQALRTGRETSMWHAIAAVAAGDAAAVVSSGNTGALMAIAKYQLRGLPGVDRPAIAALWPTMRGESIVLDVGANVGVDAEQLVNFAVMGAAFARVVFGLDRPSVGLLNIGSEDVKGNDAVRTAAQILRDRDSQMTYFGFVEGNDIGAGTVDVVVTDGFTGNVALKTAEGTARLVSYFLSTALKRSVLARIGALLARGALRALRTKMDPRAANGGVFLGLNGIVVKSHGGTDATGWAAAIDLAVGMAAENLPQRISNDLVGLAANQGEASTPREPLEHNSKTEATAP